MCISTVGLGDGLGRGGLELFEGLGLGAGACISGASFKFGAHEGFGSAYGFPGIPARIHVRCGRRGAMWAHMTV